MKKAYNLVIIGYGGMGKQHHQLLKNQSQINVVGIYDIDHNQYMNASLEGLKCYDSYHDVLVDDKIDIVLIATPNHIHKELSIQALQASKHVICEKPVTLNAQELEEILEVQKQTKHVFMVHQNRRWDEDYLTLKKVYNEQTLGRMYHLEQRVFGSRGIPTDWRKHT